MPRPRKNKKSECRSTKRNSLSAEDNEPILPKAEQINANSLLTKAIMRHNKDELVDKKDKFKELNHLTTMCDEYLSTFALIGYSLQDERIVVFNAKSSKDEAALVDLLRSTFFEIASNRP